MSYPCNRSGLLTKWLPSNSRNQCWICFIILLGEVAFHLLLRWLHWNPSITEGQQFVFTGLIVREWICFSLFKAKLLAASPYADLWNTLPLYCCLMQYCFWKRNAFHMEIKPALDSYLWTQLSQNNSAMAYEDVVVVYRQNRSIRDISTGASMFWSYRHICFSFSYSQTMQIWAK